MSILGKKTTGGKISPIEDRLNSTVKEKTERSSSQKKDQINRQQKGLPNELKSSKYASSDLRTTRISFTNLRRLKLICDGLPGVYPPDVMDNLIDDFFEKHKKALEKMIKL